MSGDLEIDHGGAIAVDTEAMRDVGRRMTSLASHLEEARDAVMRARGIIVGAPGFAEQVDVGALEASRDRIGALRSEVDEASIGTLLMADAFEIVELRAEAEALAHTDAAAAAALEARIDRMVTADARIGAMADQLVAQWENERFEGLDTQWDMGELLPPFFTIGAFIGTTARLGHVLPGMTLKGDVEPVSVTTVKSSTPDAPPATLRGAFERMPKDASAQVAVEKLRFDDGSTKYMVYLKGTQNFVPWQAGGPEPWDMKSNAELYTGEKSASYKAVIDALHAAGAESGDTIGVVAHSQAGMIAVHMAMESSFDVEFVATAGSPTVGTFRDDLLAVQILHTDDVVGSMSGGGSPAGSGSPDSFIATRVADPNPGIQDLALAPHRFEPYLETAEMIDESDDPRAVALDDYWTRLGEAVSVERTEYHAERTR
ncbi:hypothetical protein [Microbacterium sp. LBN7]|uniref:hypothetical protein n=1 Tax=Microbacterium sp. LBN7 TaxID=3129773 RepID=UPI003243E190